jgi:hypothetical protein
VMEGGVMQSRAHRAIEPFDASLEHLRGYFRLLMAEREQANLKEKQQQSIHGKTEEQR